MTESARHGRIPPGQPDRGVAMAIVGRARTRSSTWPTVGHSRAWRRCSVGPARRCVRTLPIDQRPVTLANRGATRPPPSDSAPDPDRSASAGTFGNGAKGAGGRRRARRARELDGAVATGSDLLSGQGSRSGRPRPSAPASAASRGRRRSARAGPSRRWRRRCRTARPRAAASGSRRSRRPSRRPASG